jgi:hypothetical protein
MSCVTEKPLADDSVLAETLSVIRSDRGSSGPSNFGSSKSITSVSAAGCAERLRIPAQCQDYNDVP